LQIDEVEKEDSVTIIRDIKNLEPIKSRRLARKNSIKSLKSKRARSLK